MTDAEIKVDVAKTLLKIKAVSLNVKNPFTYTSGILSPVYTDCRLLMSYPPERRKIIDYMHQLIKEKTVDVISGTASAGIPHAAWLAEKMNLPLVYVRKEEKGHGKKNIIEGVLEAGQNVLVVEDLVSTGKSSLATIDAIRKAGGKVEDCAAIFHYNIAETEDAFKNAGVRLHYLSDFNTTLDVAVKQKYLSEEDVAKAHEWNKNPKNWRPK